MKLLGIALFGMAMSYAAQAGTLTRITCEFTEGNLEGKMQFVVFNLENAKKAHIEINESGDLRQTPLKLSYRKIGETKWITPKDPYSKFKMGVLNGVDSGGIYFGTGKSGEAILGMSSGDDCVSAQFHIYANSGFSRGHYSAQNDCGTDDRVYSPLKCNAEKI